MSEESKGRLLVVEDDEAIAVALRDGFAYEGYDVVVERDGQRGLAAAMGDGFDLIILDVMLPRMSGLDICKRLRSEGRPTPILMLTARGQEIDKVLGLKLGADDYVTKPFGFLELSARVEALLRRSGGHDRSLATYSFGDVTIDFKSREARRGGRSVDLTPREFELLAYFIENRGEVIERERLLSAVWGYRHMSVTRTVDMHIAKLRKKIEENPSEPVYIVTVHRVGYKFNG